MTSTNPIPGLLSLRIHRGVNSLLVSDSTPSSKSEVQSVNGQSLHQQTKSKEGTTGQIDHSKEIKMVKQMLEQQSFDIISYLNKLHDARKNQDMILKQFREKSETIESRLKSLTKTLFQKVDDMNRRINIINKTITPKPILIKYLPENSFGRITSITASMNLVACTTALGYLPIYDRDNNYELLSCYQTDNYEALFSPALVFKHNSNAIFALTSSGKLLSASPAWIPLDQIIDIKVESFSIPSDIYKHESYDIITGHQGFVNFYSFQDNFNGLSLCGSLKKLVGIVNHIICDPEKEAIYCLTNRRYFYSISSVNFTLLQSYQFNQTPLNIQLSTVFILISLSPDEIFVLERQRDKVSVLQEVSISGGLRCFCYDDNQIFIVTKQQTVERRRLYKLDQNEIICEPDVADYDENEYIGCVFAYDSATYLSHNNRISVWS